MKQKKKKNPSLPNKQLRRKHLTISYVFFFFSKVLRKEREFRMGETVTNKEHTLDQRTQNHTLSPEAAFIQTLKSIPPFFFFICSIPHIPTTHQHKTNHGSDCHKFHFNDKRP